MCTQSSTKNGSRFYDASVEIASEHPDSPNESELSCYGFEFSLISRGHFIAFRCGVETEIGRTPEFTEGSSGLPDFRTPTVSLPFYTSRILSSPTVLGYVTVDALASVAEGATLPVRAVFKAP